MTNNKKKARPPGGAIASETTAGIRIHKSKAATDAARAEREQKLATRRALAGGEPGVRPKQLGGKRERHLALDGRPLADAREALGVTQQELADRIGWSRSMVGQTERAESPQITTALEYVAGLGADLEIRAGDQVWKMTAAPRGEDR